MTGGSHLSFSAGPFVVAYALAAKQAKASEIPSCGLGHLPTFSPHGGDDMAETCRRRVTCLRPVFTPLETSSFSDAKGTTRKGTWEFVEATRCMPASFYSRHCATHTPSAPAARFQGVSQRRPPCQAAPPPALLA